MQESSRATRKQFSVSVVYNRVNLDGPEKCMYLLREGKGTNASDTPNQLLKIMVAHSTDKDGSFTRAGSACRFTI